MMTVTSQSTTGTVVDTPELSDIGIVLNITPKVGGRWLCYYESQTFNHNFP